MRKAAELHALSAAVEMPDAHERGQVYDGSHFGDEEGGALFASPYGSTVDRHGPRGMVGRHEVHARAGAQLLRQRIGEIQNPSERSAARPA